MSSLSGFFQVARAHDKVQFRDFLISVISNGCFIKYRLYCIACKNRRNFINFVPELVNFRIEKGIRNISVVFLFFTRIGTFQTLLRESVKSSNFKTFLVTWFYIKINPYVEIFSPLYKTCAVKSTKLFSICEKGKVPQDDGIFQNG